MDLGTKSDPFLSWGKAADCLTKGGLGQVVYLRGTIASGVIRLIGKGGTMVSPLVLRPWPSPDNQVLITDSVVAGAVGDSSQWPVTAKFAWGIYLQDCEWVVIDGLQRQDFVWRGIAGAAIYAKNCDHLVIANVQIEWVSNSAIHCDFTPSSGRSNNRDLAVFNCRTDYTNLGIYDTNQGNKLSLATETISIVNYDDFEVTCCHVSNSMQEGIDAKQGSKNGRIHANIVEYTRSVGIYLNEARDTWVYHNKVGFTGYYQQRDALGNVTVVIGSQFLGGQINNPNQTGGSVGITVGNGDLGCNLEIEAGIATGNYVFWNDVYWTLGPCIMTSNNWRLWLKTPGQGPCCPPETGCKMPLPPNDGDVQAFIFNNTCYAGMQDVANNKRWTSGGFSAAIQLDVSTRGWVANNAIEASKEYAVVVFDGDDPAWASRWPTRLRFYNQLYGVLNTGDPLGRLVLPPGAFGSSPQSGDPVFFGPPLGIGGPRGDLRVQVGSKAIDNGLIYVNLAQAKLPDIGAHEMEFSDWVAGNDQCDFLPSTGTSNVVIPSVGGAA